MSSKGEALSTDAGPASSGHLSPRVVLGVPPSNPPESLETPPPLVLDTKAPATKSPQTMPSFDFDARPATLPPPPPVLEAKVVEEVVDGKLEAKIVEVAPVEAVAEPVAAIESGWSEAPPPVVDAAATIVDAPLFEPKPDLAATLVQGSRSEVEPAVVAAEPVEAPKPNFAKTLTFGSAEARDPARDRAAELRERKEARERLKDQRAAAQAAAAIVAPATDPDEISVPPAGNLEVEDEKFFSEGDLSVHDPVGAHADGDDHYMPEKAIRKSLPHVVQRRAKLAAYVKMAVAGAAVVCVAALGSAAFSGRQHPTTVAKAPAAIQAVQAEMPVVTPKAAEPAAAPAPEPAKAVEPIAAPAAEPVAEVATKAEEIAGDAKEELKKSRTALERRKLPEAIEAGERSVALDPTDGEAWLILGAAYQEKGNLADARRCYSACMKQGKTGPRSECAKMLR